MASPHDLVHGDVLGAGPVRCYSLRGFSVPAVPSKMTHTSQHLVAVLAVQLVWVAAAGAQLRPDVDPEETSDQRSQEPSPEEEVEQKNEARTEEDGIQRFEDVSIDRIRPDELPPAESTEMPDVLRGGQLPTAPSSDELEDTARTVRSNVFEVIAVQTPEAPGKTTPVVHRGHAVFVQGPREDAPPVLVTSYFWLSKAEKLYVVPRSMEDDLVDDDEDAPTVEQRTLEDVSIDGRGDRWVEEHRDELVAANLFRPDDQRNLVVVVPESIDDLGLPDEGLELFDLSAESPTRLYGFSPQGSSGLTQAKISGGGDKHQALTYYLQTEFRPVFGAPIVSTSGQLLTLTAFRHPKKIKQQVSLVVPPAPLRNYLEEIQAVVDKD